MATGKRRPKAVPAPETIVSESTLLSPKGRVYRVLRTTQRDAYDVPPAPVSDEGKSQSTRKERAKPRRSENRGQARKRK